MPPVPGAGSAGREGQSDWDSGQLHPDRGSPTPCSVGEPDALLRGHCGREAREVVPKTASERPRRTL